MGKKRYEVKWQGVTVATVTTAKEAYEMAYQLEQKAKAESAAKLAHSTTGN